MSITSIIVLFAVTWFMVFLIILPLRLTTQGDAGEVVLGTPRGAPKDEIVGRKAQLTTAVAIVVWALLAAVLTSNLISIRSFDWTHHLGPVQQN